MKRTENIQGKNPFKVPENYFEDVTRKIISATAGTGSVSAKSGLYRRLRPYLAVAASLAAFIILSYTAVRIFLPAGTNEDVPSISLQEFSESYLYDIDLLTLEENAEFLILNEVAPDISSSEIVE
jgi:hypothetical protein